MNNKLFDFLIDGVLSAEASRSQQALDRTMKSISTLRPISINEGDVDLAFEGYKRQSHISISSNSNFSTEKEREIEKKAFDAYWDKKKECYKELLRSKGLFLQYR